MVMVMPFNATTYRANKHRKDAWRHLAEARDIKNRMAKGEAYDWEPQRIETFVKLARISMKLYLWTRIK